MTGATPDLDPAALHRRIASVVVGVVVAAARDARRARLVVLDADTPEGDLLGRWLLEAHTGLPIETVTAGDGADLARRAAGRSAAGGDGLLLNPVNKTVALLFPETVAEPVLPLADLYASQVARLAGTWSAPAEACTLIERSGGIGATDAFFVRHLDERRPLEECLSGLPEPARAALRDRLEAAWWWRRRLGVVPKLGSRTIGIDLR